MDKLAARIAECRRDLRRAKREGNTFLAPRLQLTLDSLLSYRAAMRAGDRARAAGIIR